MDYAAVTEIVKDHPSLFELRAAPGQDGLLVKLTRTAGRALANARCSSQTDFESCDSVPSGYDMPDVAGIFSHLRESGRVPTIESSAMTGYVKDALAEGALFSSWWVRAAGSALKQGMPGFANWASSCIHAARSSGAQPEQLVSNNSGLASTFGLVDNVSVAPTQAARFFDAPRQTVVATPRLPFQESATLGGQPIAGSTKPVPDCNNAAAAVTNEMQSCAPIDDHATIDMDATQSLRSDVEALNGEAMSESSVDASTAADIDTVVDPDETQPYWRAEVDASETKPRGPEAASAVIDTDGTEAFGMSSNSPPPASEQPLPDQIAMAQPNLCHGVAMPKTGVNSMFTGLEPDGTVSSTAMPTPNKVGAERFSDAGAAVHLLHPLSPTNRLLVVGDTRVEVLDAMMQALDNFFFDPRPKIVVVPSMADVNEFYAALIMSSTRCRLPLICYFLCACACM